MAKDVKRVLVTGGSGKIGRNLIPALVEAGYQVRATEFRTPLTFEGVEVVKGSVTDEAFVKKAVAGMDAPAIAHAAEERLGRGQIGEPGLGPYRPQRTQVLHPAVLNHDLMTRLGAAQCFRDLERRLPRSGVDEAEPRAGDGLVAGPHRSLPARARQDRRKRRDRFRRRQALPDRRHIQG